MKINWGTGIVIAIVCFIGFIMYFVVSMSTDKKFNHDLVTEKYYEKELAYQEKIEASKNAKSLGEDIEVQRVEGGLRIRLPKSFENKPFGGKVFLYRPSNKQLDFEMPVSKDHNYLLVPEKRLLGGRWNISVEIKLHNKEYLFTEEISY